jgi:hypothetical protein
MVSSINHDMVFLEHVLGVHTACMGLWSARSGFLGVWARNTLDCDVL